MQLSFDLGGDDPVAQRLIAVRRRLGSVFSGALVPGETLDPVSQLVRSSLGARTYDQVSSAAFKRLRDSYSDWRALAAAPTQEVRTIIAGVEYADDKALHLGQALRRLLVLKGELTLDYLSARAVEDAMAELQRFKGVGLKVAAAVLNFSTLNRRVMVVDTHVKRVAHRLGLSRTDKPKAVYTAIMTAAPAEWAAADFGELHDLLKLLGQTWCVHRQPACRVCVLADVCPTSASGAAGVRARPERRPRPDLTRASPPMLSSAPA